MGKDKHIIIGIRSHFIEISPMTAVGGGARFDTRTPRARGILLVMLFLSGP